MVKLEELGDVEDGEEGKEAKEKPKKRRKKDPDWRPDEEEEEQVEGEGEKEEEEQVEGAPPRGSFAAAFAAGAPVSLEDGEDGEDEIISEDSFFHAGDEECEEGEDEEDGHLDRLEEEKEQLRQDQASVRPAPPPPPLIADYNPDGVPASRPGKDSLRIHKAEDVARTTEKELQTLLETGFVQGPSIPGDVGAWLTYCGLTHNTIALDGRVTLPQTAWAMTILAAGDDRKRYSIDTIRKYLEKQLEPAHVHKRPLFLTASGVVRSFATPEGVMAAGLVGDAQSAFDGHAEDEEEEELEEEGEEERIEREGKEEKKEAEDTLLIDPSDKPKKNKPEVRISGHLLAHAHLAYYITAFFDQLARDFPATLHECKGEDELERALKQAIQQSNGAEYSTAGKRLLIEHNLPAGCAYLYRNANRGHGTHFDVGDMMKTRLEPDAIRLLNAEMGARLFRDTPMNREGTTPEQQAEEGLGYPDLRPTSLDAWRLQAFIGYVEATAGQTTTFLKDYVIAWQDWGTPKADTIYETLRDDMPILPRILCEGPGRYYCLDRGKRWTSNLADPSLVRALRVWEDRAPDVLDGNMENGGKLPPRMVYDETLVIQKQGKSKTASKKRKA